MNKVAQVTSAVALTQKEMQQLGEIIHKKTKEKYQLTNIVDPKIVGGFVLRIADNEVDLSLKGRLRQLTENIS